ncbi:MAG: TrkA family potassium uptake protein [Erysipelotrichaceae bacterium]
MKSSTDKQYVILGLGIFGSTVAKTLSEFNCEVLAIDSDITCVERLADTVTQSVQCDITDKEQLAAAGVADCDVAIVAIGSHLEESILAIINLKELGVPYIVAKAKNKRYMQIMSKVGADKVVRPEKEMGVQVAKSLLASNIIDLINLDDEYNIVELNAPESWVNKSLRDLDARNKFGINVLGIRKVLDKKLSISPDGDYIIQADDHLLVITDNKSFEKLDFK